MSLWSYKKFVKSIKYHKILLLKKFQKFQNSKFFFYFFFLELGDGSYHPLWTMKGYTQTFHLWKENRRVNSVPLNAFLTFVTLPWWSIIRGIILNFLEGVSCIVITLKPLKI